MVAAFTELSVPRLVEDRGDPGRHHHTARLEALSPVSFGDQLIARASALDYVRAGGRGIKCFAGTPLRLTLPPRDQAAGFLRGSIFAVIADDGAMCLRLQRDVAEDLIENGLCVQAGRNQLTWPLVSINQLNVSWRILLHAYWTAVGMPTRRARRLWSEWVINH